VFGLIRMKHVRYTNQNLVDFHRRTRRGESSILSDVYQGEEDIVGDIVNETEMREIT